MGKRLKSSMATLIFWSITSWEERL